MTSVPEENSSGPSASRWAHFSNQTVTTLALFASVILGILASAALFSPKAISASDLYLSWVLAAWGGAMIFAQAHRHAISLLDESGPGLSQAALTRKAEIQKLVDETWQPYVRNLIGKENVCVAAAEMIRRAQKEQDYSDRFIFFQGAASLSTSSKREEEWGVLEDEDSITPYQLYSGAIDDAVSDNIKMRRFIALPTAEDLSDRSSFLVRDYMDWTSKEFYRLKRNENYVLVDALNAPEWRSGVSAILTRRAIFFIVGKGEVGLLIQDDGIAEAMRIAINESQQGAELRAIYGEPGPSRKDGVAKFKKQVGEIRSIRDQD